MQGNHFMLDMICYVGESLELAINTNTCMCPNKIAGFHTCVQKASVLYVTAEECTSAGKVEKQENLLK